MKMSAPDVIKIIPIAIKKAISLFIVRCDIYFTYSHRFPCKPNYISFSTHAQEASLIAYFREELFIHDLHLK